MMNSCQRRSIHTFIHTYIHPSRLTHNGVPILPAHAVTFTFEALLALQCPSSIEMVNHVFNPQRSMCALYSYLE
jgi:hypothetical protein